MPELRNEKISVVIFQDRGLARSQQMFADLNKHAVKPTKSLGLLYDHRSAFARFVVSLVDNVDIFYGRIEMERNNITGRSLKLFTLNAVSDATRYLLKLKTKTVSSDKQKMAASYWDKVSRSIPEWNLLMQKKLTPYELRKDYVHAHANILCALGMAGNVLLRDYPDSWRTKLRALHHIRWEKDNPEWDGKAMLNGRMLNNSRGIRASARLILKACNAQPLEHDLGDA